MTKDHSGWTVIQKSGWTVIDETTGNPTSGKRGIVVDSTQNWWRVKFVDIENPILVSSASMGDFTIEKPRSA